MESVTVTVDADGGFIIPEAFRKELSLKDDQKFLCWFDEHRQCVVIKKVEDEVK